MTALRFQTGTGHQTFGGQSEKYLQTKETIATKEIKSLHTVQPKSGKLQIDAQFIPKQSSLFILVTHLVSPLNFQYQIAEPKRRMKGVLTASK